MDTGRPSQEASVKVAVILGHPRGLGKQDTFSVINEESNRLIFIRKAETDMKEHCFTFDGVFSLNTAQDKVFSELVQSLLEPVVSGYNVALLVCGTDSPEKVALLRGNGRQPGIVQQVIENIFQATKSRGEGEQSLITAGFIQFYPDGKSRDLFNPGNEELKAVNTSLLGMVVDEGAEIVVPSPDVAYGLYLRGIETAREPHCSTLFALTVEQKEAGSHTGVNRSVVQIFDLQGETPRSQGSLTLPLLQILETRDLSGNKGILPSILKQTLEGNTLCLLLYCLDMEDLSGEDIVSALSVASRLREMNKTVSPTHWDPVEAAQKLRGEVRDLRAKLLSGSQSEEDSLSQLGQALKELQVVKNQSWGKKKAASALFGEKINSQIQGSQQSSCSAVAVEGFPASESEAGLPGNQQQLPLADDKNGSHKLQDDTNQDAAVGGKGGETSRDRPCGCSRISLLKPAEEAILKQVNSRCRRICQQSVKSNKAGTSQHLDVDMVFSLAQTRRKWLKEQHRALIQRELLKMEQEGSRAQIPTMDQEEILRLQEERAVLVLQLEALRRERTEAERDVESLYQHHKQESGAQKQHILQWCSAQGRSRWSDLGIGCVSIMAIMQMCATFPAGTALPHLCRGTALPSPL